MADPQLLRWNGADPMAQEFMSESVYAYMGGDPANMVDGDGGRRKSVFELFWESPMDRLGGLAGVLNEFGGTGGSGGGGWNAHNDDPNNAFWWNEDRASDSYAYDAKTGKYINSRTGQEVGFGQFVDWLASTGRAKSYKISIEFFSVLYDELTSFDPNNFDGYIPGTARTFGPQFSFAKKFWFTGQFLVPDRLNQMGHGMLGYGNHMRNKDDSDIFDYLLGAAAGLGGALIVGEKAAEASVLYSLYTFTYNGERYWGITKDLARRRQEWERKLGIDNIPDFEAPYNRNIPDWATARGLEEIHIRDYGLENLLNKIHSISIKNPRYQEYINKATDFANSIFKDK